MPLARTGFAGYFEVGYVFYRQLFYVEGPPQIQSRRCVLCGRAFPDRATWAADLEPKLARHPAAAKVPPPLWGHLSGGVSFVLAENGEGGSPEALIGILEEPFAARTATASLPRYVLRIHNESELLGHVVELARHATSGFEPGHESGLRVAAEPTPAAG